MSSEKINTLNKIKELGLLAVIRGPSPEITMMLVEALFDGGIFGIEITYSTPNASEVVRSLKEKYHDDILLGMGTITTSEQVNSAISAGASFIVSPHTSTPLAQTMQASGLVVMMGALTPSEIIKAHDLGSDIVKIFPGSVGGPNYLKALRGPFPNIPMMPTGGVALNNIEEWFSAGAIAVGAGSGLCPISLVKEKRFKEITQLAQEYAKVVHTIHKKKAKDK